MKQSIILIILICNESAPQSILHHALIYHQASGANWKCTFIEQYKQIYQFRINAATRLSPPLSIIINFKSSNPDSSSSTASKFIEASSLVTVQRVKNNNRLLMSNGLFSLKLQIKLTYIVLNVGKPSFCFHLLYHAVNCV